MAQTDDRPGARRPGSFRVGGGTTQSGSFSATMLGAAELGTAGLGGGAAPSGGGGGGGGGGAGGTVSPSGTTAHLGLGTAMLGTVGLGGGASVAPGPIPADVWAFDEIAVGEAVAVTRAWQELAIEFAVGDDTYQDAIQPLESGAGTFTTIAAADGSYETVDTGGGSASVDVLVPDDLEPVRDEGTYYVREIERLQPSPRTAATVRVVLVPDAPKDLLASPVTQSRGTEEWLFDLADGAVATHRVAAEIRNESTPNDEGWDVTLVLDGSQTETVEHNLSRLGAVESVDVPDAEGYVRDTSVDDRMTVDLTSPIAADPPSGTYICTQWETELIVAGQYRMTLRLRAV